MCFGGSKPAPPAPPVVQAPPAPPPAPAPIIQPSEVSSQDQAEGRRKKLARMRSGLQSTIKTSARGIVGQGADLSAPATGKSTLGS